MANILSQAHLYIGTSMFGKVSEFKFPDVTNVVTEIKPIDSIGKYSLPVGIQLEDASLKFIGFNAKAFEELSDLTSEHLITVRGNLKEFNGVTLKDEQAIKGTIRCITKKITSLGTIKGQENAEFVVELIPHAIKLEHKGKVLTEIDIPNNIYTNNSEDMLSKMRSNLGLN